MRQLSGLAHEYTAMGVLGPIQLIGRRSVEYPLVHDTASYTKIQVDGSVAKSKLRGAASAVCRDDDGRYLGSSSLVVRGIIDVATVEVMPSSFGSERRLDDSKCYNCLRFKAGGEWH